MGGDESEGDMKLWDDASKRDNSHPANTASKGSISRNSFCHNGCQGQSPLIQRQHLHGTRGKSLRHQGCK